MVDARARARYERPGRVASSPTRRSSSRPTTRSRAASSTSGSGTDADDVDARTSLDDDPARWRARARRGFAFNMLTSYSDPERMRDDLYYADPCALLRLCKRELSRHVALLHDYGLWEFTIVVRQGAVRDEAGRDLRHRRLRPHRRTSTSRRQPARGRRVHGRRASTATDDELSRACRSSRSSARAQHPPAESARCSWRSASARQPGARGDLRAVGAGLRADHVRQLARRRTGGELELGDNCFVFEDERDPAVRARSATT